MTPVLNELMWDAHRAESEGALVGGFVGIITDPRNEERIPIARGIDDNSDYLVSIHNMGVANGIKAFLSKLSESGYVIRDKDGNLIDPGESKDLGSAWELWFKTPTARISE